MRGGSVGATRTEAKQTVAVLQELPRIRTISSVTKKPIIWVKAIHILWSDKRMFDKDRWRQLFPRQQIQGNSQ